MPTYWKALEYRNIACKPDIELEGGCGFVLFSIKGHRSPDRARHFASGIKFATSPELGTCMISLPRVGSWRSQRKDRPITIRTTLLRDFSFTLPWPVRTAWIKKEDGSSIFISKTDV